MKAAATIAMEATIAMTMTKMMTTTIRVELSQSLQLYRDDITTYNIIMYSSIEMKYAVTRLFLELFQSKAPKKADMIGNVYEISNNMNIQS